MRMLGHGAIGYLWIKGTNFRKTIPSVMVPLILFFSNILDMFHNAPLRIIGHNYFGSLILASLWALVLSRIINLKLIYWAQLVMVTVFAHSLGDLLFGSYYPFVPFSTFRGGLFSFGSPVHLITEAALGLIFVTVVYFSGDYQRYKEWFQDRWGKMTKTSIKLTWANYRNRFFLTLMLVMFSLYAVLITSSYFHKLMSFTWYVWLVIIFFYWIISMPLHPISESRDYNSSKIN